MKKTILKIVAVVLVMIGLLVLLCACESHQVGNRITHGKDVQSFQYAYVYLDGNKIVEGYVSQWRDYEDSDAVQVQIDGKFYLTHYSNVILVADPSLGGIVYDSGVVDHN